MLPCARRNSGDARRLDLKNRSVIRRIGSLLALACFGVALALGLLEALIRIVGETDADGQFRFMDLALEPYALPVSAMRESIETYIARQDEVTIIYDADTGWVYRPHALRHNGSFTVNGGGLRSTREYSLSPLPDTLRIAVFGDSFTADDDVRDDDTWANQLELALNGAGIRAETLNFGVGGYGMDQAYLRWLKQGRDYQPDIVIFGFQPENLDRNVNIFRHLYIHGYGIPLAKPRFLLRDGELAPLNSPVIPPQQLLATFENFASHPLATYEAYYPSRDAASSWWSGSRLLAFVHAMSKAQTPPKAADYGPGSERGELGKAIVDAFAADVAGTGADFIIAHLPLQQHLQHLRAGGDSPYAHLQESFASAYNYVPLEAQLLAYADDEYHGTTGHYLPAITHVIGRTMAREIIACIESGACRLARFDDRSAFVKDTPSE